MSYSPLSSLKRTLDQIAEIVSRLSVLGTAVGVLGDIRVTPTGNVTVAIAATQTLATVTTVTTVSTVTNQAQVGGYQANPQIPALMNVEATLANIDNIIIS